MNDPRLWTGTAIDRAGSRVALVAESVSRHEGIVSVAFASVPRPPRHVSLRWNGASILSAADMDSAAEKLTGNPGRVAWEARERKLYFISNEVELAEVCASRRPGPHLDGASQ